MNNIVTFNGLNLKFHINDIIFKAGNIEIHIYAILIVISFILGIIYCLKNRKKLKLEWEDILILAVIIVVFSLIGARLYYVLFKINEYIINPIKILAIKDGGLAIYGGVIGGILGIYLYCKYYKIKFSKVLDFIVPILPLGQAIGRWGNFFNIEAHGTETTNIFRMGIYENGNFIEVHPTFLYESIACSVIFIILNCFKNKKSFDGELCSLYLILYGIIRTFIEGLRTDSLMFRNIKISQLLSIIIVIIGVIIIAVNKLRRKNNNEK